MNIGRSEETRKRLILAGIGPGSLEDMTLRAAEAIRTADLIVGYTAYNELLKKYFPDKNYYATPMRREADRCRFALEKAAQGVSTVLVCSGDSGIYGMASLAMQLNPSSDPVDIEVIPGVTAAVSGAALLGSPLTNDFTVISLSDQLTPRAVIARRLENAARSGMAVVLYNPGSRKRSGDLQKACAIFRKYRSGRTVCGIAGNIARTGEYTEYLTLDELAHRKGSMDMTVFIGAETTEMRNGRMVTPRGYPLSQSDGIADRDREKEVASPNPGFLIFGGTGEGRMLAEEAVRAGFAVTLCVATEYGESVLPDTLKASPLLELSVKGMTFEEMCGIMKRHPYRAVIDATHPHARDVTEKIRKAAEKTGLPYHRVRRERTEPLPENRVEGAVTYVPDLQSCIPVLNRDDRKIFVAAGSSGASVLRQIRNAEERLVFRILPSVRAVQACLDAGFKGKNLICMQGPFSEAMNLAMFQESGAEILITKDSGTAGGFPEKLRVAGALGMQVLVIRAPEETDSMTVEEMTAWMHGEEPDANMECRAPVPAGTGGRHDPGGKPDTNMECRVPVPALTQAAVPSASADGSLTDDVPLRGCAGVREPGKTERRPGMEAERDPVTEHRIDVEPDGTPAQWEGEPGNRRKKQVVIAGIGPGCPDMVTAEVRQAVDEAELLIGAPRMLECFSASGKETIGEYRPEKIREHIRSTEARNIAILVSGDPSVYSAAGGIRDVLTEESVRVMPGISSVSCLAARIGHSLEDAVVRSAHGRVLHPAAEVRRNRKTFLLAGRNASSLLHTLEEYGFGHLRVFLGENLSYPEERILHGTVAELKNQDTGSLSVLCVLNPQPDPGVFAGLPDHALIRGRVPMTKQAVRAVTMAALRVKPEDTVYDIGAGTGSVSIEAASAAWRGEVYAIEPNPEAVTLIDRNRHRFGMDQIHIVAASAPEGLDGLPVPDRVFIGGSNGKMKEILDALVKKISEEERTIRLVINAVSLETLHTVMSLLPQYPVRNAEWMQVSCATGKQAGSHHLLRAQNPVFVIAADLDPEGGDSDSQ